MWVRSQMGRSAISSSIENKLSWKRRSKLRLFRLDLTPDLMNVRVIGEAIIHPDLDITCGP